DRVPVFAVAALLLAAAWGAGSWTIRPALRRRLTGLEAQLLAVAVGLNFWSLWVLVLGLAGGLHSVWLLRGPMLVAVLLGLWHAMPARSRTGRAEQPTSSNDPITAKAHGLGRLSFNKTTF